MAISFLNESSFNSDVTFTGSTFGIHGTGSALSIGDPSSGLGRSSLFAFGTDTFHIQQDQAGGNIQIETDDFIVKNHGASETYIRAQDNSSVELYHNNSKKLETTSSGISVTGNVVASGHVMLADNLMIRLGTGYDFSLYHTGSHNYINTGNGNIELRHTVGGANEPMLKAIPDGAVMLYHNGSTKLENSSQTVKILIGTFL